MYLLFAQVSSSTCLSFLEVHREADLQILRYHLQRMTPVAAADGDDRSVTVVLTMAFETAAAAVASHVDRDKWRRLRRQQCSVVGYH